MRIFVPSEDGPYKGSMRLVPYQPGLICEHALRNPSGIVEGELPSASMSSSYQPQDSEAEVS